MTDTFWFHICWNVESVTWPLWYRMIYRALTPVANVFAEGRGRASLQVDSVYQITFMAAAIHGLCFHSEVFRHISSNSFFLYTFFIKVAIHPNEKSVKGWVKLPPRGYSASSHWQYHLEEKGNFNWTSLSILVVHKFHAPIRQGLSIYRHVEQQTKLSEICPVCIMGPAKVVYITK